MSKTFTTILPSAGRLMGSLRDIGYDSPSAVADLVDNSIDANARHVAINVHADGENSWLRVVDDGIGMSPAQLDEAMRYGSHSQYDERALGHFGLGLKTASLSQCRRLTVASRSKGRARIAIRRWDLDEVLRRDSWDLETVALRDAPHALLDSFPQGSGTVVLWEKPDRLLPKKPTLGLTARVLARTAQDIAQHVSMVFHRFLDGEAYSGRRTLGIEIEGTSVPSWDPYARQEERTQALPVQRLELGGDRAVSVEVRPYVLPAQHAFSSPDAHRRAGGPNRWNRHQGFYVYRRDRLIQAGGWNRLRTLDEHAKLARISIDLPLGHEDLFAVDVAKRRITIPDELRPELRAIASGTVAVAQQRYRDHLESNAEAGFYVIADRSPEAISVSRDWPAIMQAVEDVLGHDPVLRDALLLRLANADPDDMVDRAA